MWRHYAFHCLHCVYHASYTFYSANIIRRNSSTVYNCSQPNEISLSIHTTSQLSRTAPYVRLAKLHDRSLLFWIAPQFSLRSQKGRVVLPPSWVASADRCYNKIPFVYFIDSSSTFLCILLPAPNYT